MSKTTPAKNAAPMIEDKPELWSTNQAAEYLSLKPAALYSWREQGVFLRYYKIAGSIRYRAQDVRDFLANSLVDASK